ncbi:MULTISPECIES: hypothetical protein [Zhongshania]|jgi:hypothetical protein|uniref:Uncharacterized protein n=1 Tax=Zhongshania antarctica TaxID=641702 RepID=A0A840R5X8_9GAMM|nr:MULTISPECIES: hypothetical protein [Zhongshania]MBB5187810.1 hypothetical protein [Zhongshania antarctica]
MATSTQTIDNAIFGDNLMRQASLNQNGAKRSEWWLNVNYAETIEINHAVSALQRRGN